MAERKICYGVTILRNGEVLLINRRPNRADPYQMGLPGGVVIGIKESAYFRMQTDFANTLGLSARKSDMKLLEPATEEAGVIHQLVFVGRVSGVLKLNTFADPQINGLGFWFNQYQIPPDNVSRHVYLLDRIYQTNEWLKGKVTKGLEIPEYYLRRSLLTQPEIVTWEEFQEGQRQ